MSPSSSITHDCTDAYKYSIFYGFVASPPPVGNNTVYFLVLYFPSPSVSTILTFYEILMANFLQLSSGLGFGIGGLPASVVPQCHPCCLFPLCYFCLWDCDC